MPEKVAIIGIVGLPANYGGFETLADNLVTENGELFRVYCSSAAYKEKSAHYKKAELVYLPLKANGIQSIAYDVISIFHALLSGYRKLLVLGVSGAIAIKLARFLFPKAAIITNIDGLEWQRQKWNTPTKFLLKYLERLAVNNSTHVVCDNPVILDYVKKRYDRVGTFIAYGGDHAISTANPAPWNQEAPAGYHLGICRIEPENNIHTILQAFSETNERIIFIGNWQASEYGRNLQKKFSKFDHMQLLDPIYEQEKLFNLRSNCTAYIHGHSAGGTNPSLVEMMHFGKPIIAFDCSYNRATMMNKGIYFRDVHHLKKILTEKTPEQHSGKILKKIAQENYSWKIIREKYFKLLKINHPHG